MSNVRVSVVLQRAPLFVNSWGAVNAARLAAGGGVLVLKSGVALAGFEVQIQELQAANTAVAAQDDQRVIMAAGRLALRTRLHDEMDGWRKAALYQLDGTPLVSDLPTLPSPTSGDEELVKVNAAVLTRWESMNAATGVAGFTPPLVTRTGTTRQNFNDLVTELAGKVGAIGSLDDNLKLSRGNLENLADAIYAIFAEYRKAILAEYPDDSPFVENLPTLSAPNTGTTPEAVQLSATFDPATRTAHATWTASEAAHIERYSLRISAGPKYKSEAEATIGDLAPEVREFSIGAQYLPVGATVWAKVYVVTDGDREKGSNAEKVSG